MQRDTSETVLGIACFDLNGLKEVNDDRGHSAGDALICRAAEQLRQIFEDRVYRTGGDEFVIVDTQMDETSFSGRCPDGAEGNAGAEDQLFSWLFLVLHGM